MISMTKHLVEKIVQCILVVGCVDIAKNEVAKGRHLEDVTKSINKTNGSADMGLKEGVKLSTLMTGAHIGSLGNKGDKVEGVEVQGTMSTCITSVSGAINTRVVRTTLKASETSQHA
jgi:hypothetical protein